MKLIMRLFCFAVPVAGLFAMPDTIQAQTVATTGSKIWGEGQPRPEHPRPDMLRESWQNLNGTWDFEIDNGISGEERGLHTGKALSGKIVVPFCPESELSGINNKDFMPCVWYRRTVTIPNDWKDQRVLLHFGACDYDTTVWINGKRAGAHRGGYSSFHFDVSPHLAAGENTIVVRAVDDTRSPLQPKGKQCHAFQSVGCHYTRTTGIWQTVWLEAVPQTYIKNIQAHAQIEQKRVAYQVNILGPTQGATLTAVVNADGKNVGEAKVNVSGNTQITIDLAEVTLWEPLKPFLHDVEFTLAREGVKSDVVKSYFGMRDISIEGNKVLINGKSVFQRLVLDQGFYPDGIYTAPTDAALKKDIELSLAMGFNGGRLHQKVFEPRFLYWADKLGYMVWGEYPSWGLDSTHVEALERVLPEWMECLERDFNHPSIVGWCPFNETPNNARHSLLRTVYLATKAIDPTRPVIDASGYLHVETDIFDVHDYEQDPVKMAARYDDFKTTGAPYRNYPDHDIQYAGQPYFLSEYGGIWWSTKESKESWGYGERPKSVDDMVARYKGLTSYLLNHPKMFAFCYTQLTDVEQEQNGLYTYDRKPKFDPNIIKEINSQPAAIEK